MDWDLLHCFLAVSETGSLSAAARRLKLSQPTVGRRMAALEDRLGTRLFERPGRRLVLTAEGESLHETVKRMEDEALAAERRLGGRDVALSGIVRIACTAPMSLPTVVGKAAAPPAACVGKAARPKPRLLCAREKSPPRG